MVYNKTKTRLFEKLEPENIWDLGLINNLLLISFLQISLSENKVTVNSGSNKINITVNLKTN